MPDTHSAPVAYDSKVEGNIIFTRIDSAINWMRKNSLWPMPMGLACCAIELMATGASRFDISRFGAEVMRFSPRQSDVMIVAGTVTYKMALAVKRVWDQMPEPKWCLAMGACASSGGMYRSYAVLQGIDHLIPVDVYISGCPPRPRSSPRGPHETSDEDRRRIVYRGTKKRAHRESQLKLTNQEPGRRMNLQEIVDTLSENFGEKILEVITFRDEKTVLVDLDNLVTILTCSRDLGFDYLVDISGIDNMGEEPRFEIVYELYSYHHRVYLRVKARLSEDDPTVDTVSDLWPTANWHEREIYDMMGIEFRDHPDLRRILMWEGYPYHPLRKEFPLAGKPSATPETAFTEPAPASRRPLRHGGRRRGHREARTSFAGLRLQACYHGVAV